jgi:D-lactate dehydrogenase
MLTGGYRELYDRLAPTVPVDRLLHGELETLAYGTDASFYRLIPKLVVKVESEAEVISVLRETRRLGLPLTFRAAGTSLSGQSISDSVLVILGNSWRRYQIRDNGKLIALQPGVIGSYANARLAPLGRKIGPDPASINSAMIGGIAANNASGMCCGTAQNSYRTLHAMRMVLADGTVLDTGDPESRTDFARSHSQMLERLSALSARVQQHPTLAARIRRKYSMKNTTGYSLNALIDFDDPVDILQHLMIGSEGTLGFIAEITYRTVPDLPHKASSLMLFPDIVTACNAVIILKRCPVDAVELMDRASIRSVENKEGMPGYLASLGADVAALLVETKAADPDTLSRQVDSIRTALAGSPVERPLEFTTDPVEYTTFWDIRKGLFPSVGAMRKTGTTVIIEDVAFPIAELSHATEDLQGLFRKHGYDDAIIFGHALEGNLHFVFKQDFNTAAEIDRYAGFIEDVTTMVVQKYDGSLKAEHGTGRNMAPFVELEWGQEATAIMHEIKSMLDPDGLLNPGVILNADPSVHLKNLKPLPTADPLVDKCIECGFCEVHCPSRNLTLTPRQRIVVYREIARLRASGSDRPRLEALRKAYRYFGDQTCATDGLCATSCPVTIDTGKLIKQLREREIGPVAAAIATMIERNMAAVTAILRVVLNGVDLIHRMLGTRAMSMLARTARAASLNMLPLWNPHMPRGADRLPSPTPFDPWKPSVVYFPTCINRTMGVSAHDRGKPSLTSITVLLLQRAGYNIVFPEHIDSLCCGMAFASKGFRTQGDRKTAELEKALQRASDQGRIPILIDMSPCRYRLKETLSPSLTIHEPVRFLLEHVIQRLTIRKVHRKVAIHTTCSAEKMGLGAGLKQIAEMCADEVIVPEGVECCGWAGDRGFTAPELNASALSDLRAGIPQGCTEGYSTSRTCEIGLSLHSGVPYRSILNLVQECSEEQKQPGGLR